LFHFAEPLTFLSSAKNGLITVYDVSAGKDNFTHLNTPAYALPSLPIIGTKRIGQTIFRHPNDPSDTSALLLQLGDRGSIHRLDLGLNSGDRGTQPSGHTYDWSQEVLYLEKTMEAAIADVAVFNNRAFTEVDMDPIYRSMQFLLFLKRCHDTSSGRDFWP
jgi:hypothetical protein